jgi:hypothetical protein
VNLSVLTIKSPKHDVIPLVAFTVNLSVLTIKSPKHDVIPLVALTVNLLVLTLKSPKHDVIPVAALTVNLLTFTLRSPLIFVFPSPPPTNPTSKVSTLNFTLSIETGVQEIKELTLVVAIPTVVVPIPAVIIDADILSRVTKFVSEPSR